MKKVLKFVGIGFLVLIVIGAIASMGEDPQDDLATGTTEPSQETSTPADTEESKEEPTKIEEPEKPDFEVLEHSFKEEEFVSYVVGTIINNTEKEYGYVQVEINLYDAEDALLGSTLANVNNLGANEKWKFKAAILEDGVSSYKIKDITGF